MDPASSANGSSSFIVGLGWLAIHIAIPAAFIKAILTEIGRKNTRILGYTEEVKNSNILWISVFLILYIALLVAYHSYV